MMNPDNKIKLSTIRSMMTGSAVLGLCAVILSWLAQWDFLKYVGVGLFIVSFLMDACQTCPKCGKWIGGRHSLSATYCRHCGHNLENE